MDLIYCNQDFVDLGILQNYTMDMAYGFEENNFVIDTELHDPELKIGYYIYFNDTEYGGIVDAIEIDTKSQMLRYKGRTWYGIFASHIIKPGNKQDYYTVQGEAQHAISALLDKCSQDNDGLKPFNVFNVPDDEKIYLLPFNVRYDDLNTVFLRALANSNARLKMEVARYPNEIYNFVKLTVVPITNYSAFDEFESELIFFKVKKQLNKVNHLICLGSGVLSNRHTIDLFSDEIGNVQNYLVDPTKEPTEDADYILDNRNQILIDNEEIASVYDYPNAQTIEHYIVTTEEPYMWADHYLEYYTKTDSGYRQNEWIGETVYILLTTKPSTFDGMDVYTKSWDDTLKEFVYNEYKGDKVDIYTDVTQYSPHAPLNWNEDKDVKGSYYTYYTYDSNTQKYIQIQPEIVYVPYDPDPYVRPVDWAENYKNYYTTDGVHYTPIGELTISAYVPTLREPSDWNTNWFSYYINYYYDPYLNEIELQLFKGEITEDQYAEYKKIHGEPTPEIYTIKLEDVSDYYLVKRKGEKLTWYPDTYLVQDSESIPPIFQPKNSADYQPLYVKAEVAPNFIDLKNSTGVYSKEETYQKVWQTDTYYRKVDNVEKIPDWQPGVYYRKTEDNYYDLVQNGIKRLKELRNVDTLEVELKENDNMYYIGDTILAREQITGVELSAYISKKIIKVERGALSVRYEVS